MPFTQEETLLTLRAIREDKEFRNKFGVIAEDIIDRVYSYFANANCPCKGAIIDWTNKNEDATRKLINTFSATFDKLKQTPPSVPVANAANPNVGNTTGQLPIPNQPPANPGLMKIGETLVIDPSPEAYKKLFEAIKKERWIFRGLQVIPGEENGKEVWFVLFY